MRTILWDLDGTLSDSGDVHFSAWELTLEQYGVAYTYDSFITDFGRSNGDLLPELLQVDYDSQKVLDVAREKESLFRQLARHHGMQPLPGVMSWLERFRNEGVLQVVSSSGRMANIVTAVELMDIGDYFDVMVSGAALPRSKPDPTIFLNSAAAVNANPGECIVIEDSLHGIGAAMRAGMNSIAVGSTLNSRKLDQLCDEFPARLCLRKPTLEDLEWDECLALWQGAT